MTVSHKKVLIITFEFPPANNPGALRMSKFAKFLPEFGWEPIILTVARNGEPPPKFTNTEIIRTKYFSIKDFFSNHGGASGPGEVQNKSDTIPKSRQDLPLRLVRWLRPIYKLPLILTLLLDPQGWYPYGVKKGLEIVSTRKVDLIFSTYSPSTCHFIASRIRQRTKVPWIAEFRDLWSLNANESKTQPFHFLEKQLEKKVMRSCNQFITVSEPLAAQIKGLHGRESEIVYNGFDEEDYAVSVPLTAKFTITYTGTMYENRNPSPLFEAVNFLKTNGKISPADFEIRFYEFESSYLRSLILKHHLQDLVKIYPAVSYRECIEKQKESTALLFIGWRDPHELGYITTKIFEYMASGRPILSLSSEDEVVSKLIKDAECGVVTLKVEEIQDTLIRWIDEFRSSRDIISFKVAPQIIKSRFTRREQTRRLADVFNKFI
jgi:glycosyltransferase involved in cell wall biosynthesis